MAKNFEELVQEYRPMMLCYARALLVGDPHRAEDVVQESCLVAYSKMDSFDASRSFPKWIRGIIRNKVLESIRREQRQAQIESLDMINGMEDVFGLFDHSSQARGWLERIEVVQECVSKLKYPMRVVVELFYQRGFTLAEIAMNLAINEMTAGKRLSRARITIRLCVSKKLNSH